MSCLLHGCLAFSEVSFYLVFVASIVPSSPVASASVASNVFGRGNSFQDKKEASVSLPAKPSSSRSGRKSSDGVHEERHEEARKEAERRAEKATKRQKENSHRLVRIFQRWCSEETSEVETEVETGAMDEENVEEEVKWQGLGAETLGSFLLQAYSRRKLTRIAYLGVMCARVKLLDHV